MLTSVVIGVVVLVIISFFMFINSGPKLPPEADDVVREVLASDLPELVNGKTALAKSGNIDIWYEIMEPKDEIQGTVLLVMGHSSTSMLWTSNFTQPIVDEGYRVIRYDNRDVGMSSWVKGWDSKNPYTLEDMAKDGLAVLDHAGVEKAHIIGVSMGGMIAQRMAISHQERVLSLTSIMASGFMMDPDIPPVPGWFAINFIKLGLRYLLFGGESGSIKFFLSIMQTLKGDGPYQQDLRGQSEIMLYENRKRRGFNKKAVLRHGRAIQASGSRLHELDRINVASLVIHGMSDPLVYFAHAEKYAPLIPNAGILFIEEMGHDLPHIYMDQVHEAIFKTFDIARKVAQTAN